MLAAVDETERGNAAIFVQKDCIRQLGDAKCPAKRFGKDHRHAIETMIVTQSLVFGFGSIPSDDNVKPIGFGIRRGSDYR